MTYRKYFAKIMNALLRTGKYGEVSEWFKELVLKTSDSERDRGFESHLLRFVRRRANAKHFFNALRRHGR